MLRAYTNPTSTSISSQLCASSPFRFLSQSMCAPLRRSALQAPAKANHTERSLRLAISTNP